MFSHIFNIFLSTLLASSEPLLLLFSLLRLAKVLHLLRLINLCTRLEYDDIWLLIDHVFLLNQLKLLRLVLLEVVVLLLDFVVSLRAKVLLEDVLPEVVHTVEESVLECFIPQLHKDLFGAIQLRSSSVLVPEREDVLKDQWLIIIIALLAQTGKLHVVRVTAVLEGLLNNLLSGRAHLRIREVDNEHVEEVSVAVVLA